jgi:hypothetical protein
MSKRGKLLFKKGEEDTLLGESILGSHIFVIAESMPLDPKEGQMVRFVPKYNSSGGAPVRIDGPQRAPEPTDARLQCGPAHPAKALDDRMKAHREAYSQPINDDRERATQPSNTTWMSPVSVNEPTSPARGPAAHPPLCDPSTEIGDVATPEDPIAVTLRTQVEYYLSPAVLRKDGFMQSKMDSTGAVALRVILTCNKIKAHTSNLHVLMQALRGSTLLEVDEVRETVRPVGGPVPLEDDARLEWDAKAKALDNRMKAKHEAYLRQSANNHCEKAERLRRRDDDDDYCYDW